MAKFDSSRIDPTQYDFTEFPHKDGADGEGNPRYCKGKGVIAEPTDAQIDAFQQAALKLSVAGERGDELSFTEGREQTTTALVELNVPREHLDELPPKYFSRFVGFVLAEFMPGNGVGA